MWYASYSDLSYSRVQFNFFFRDRFLCDVGVQGLDIVVVQGSRFRGWGQKWSARGTRCASNSDLSYSRISFSLGLYFWQFWGSGVWVQWFVVQELGFSGSGARESVWSARGTRCGTPRTAICPGKGGYGKGGFSFSFCVRLLFCGFGGLGWVLGVWGWVLEGQFPHKTVKLTFQSKTNQEMHSVRYDLVEEVDRGRRGGGIQLLVDIPFSVMKVNGP